MALYKKEVRNVIIGNSDIVNLRKKGEGKVTEIQLKEVLQRYNLRDSLLALGGISAFIYNAHDSEKISNSAYKEPGSGTIITQFALAYLANILIISGANDYNSKSLGDKDNILILANMYFECLVQPELAQDYGEMDFAKFRSSMIRMHHEQMGSQFSPAILISRSIVLFIDLVNNRSDPKVGNLSNIFKENTGLDIYECYVLSLAALGLSQKSILISPKNLSISSKGRLSHILNYEKAKKFLDFLSADYESFRGADSLHNTNLDPLFTKTRFNPLSMFPVIRSNIDKGRDLYIVANLADFVSRAYAGIYWWFHKYFESKGQQIAFRNYFGYVFQDYVGIILKGIYGDDTKPEVLYGKGLKFFDWWLERDGKVYLFEVKANQFSLDTLRIAESKDIVNKEIKKLTGAISQMYRRINDIQKYPELNMFRDKKLVPIIVFLEIPFVSTNFYEELLKKELSGMETRDGLNGLADFLYYCINIEDLEVFDSTENRLDLEDVLRAVKIGMAEGFRSVLSKNGITDFHNKILQKRYHDFFTEVGVVRQPE